VDGVDNAAVVTVTNKGTGNYKAEVTLPAELTAGARVQIRIAATVGGVAAKAIIWEDFVDPKRVGDLNDLTAQQVADAALLAPSEGAAATNSLRARVDACVTQAGTAALYSSLVNSRLPANPAAVGSAMTLANGAITADALAADAVAEIQSGLSTFDPTIDPVIVATNNDKSGYTLSASGVQAIWEYASRSLTTFGTLVSDIAATVWSWFTRTITGGSLTTSPPTAAQIADAVWDETLADHAGAGSTGAALSGATAPTAAAIADAVWDEAIAEHATAGSTGAALAAAQSAGDPWATELPGAYGSGTAGKIVGNIDSQLESIANRTQIPG